MKTTHDKVTEILVDQLAVDEGECLPGARLADDLGADSLDRIEIRMAIEEAFDIEIPDEDADKLKTVGEIVEYVDAQIKA